MELIWCGKNITEHVRVTGCVHREGAGRFGSLELTMDHASQWYRWRPEEDDEIIAVSGSYSTGAMYLSAVIPEGDQYRVLALSAKRAAQRRAWGSYADTTLGKLFDACAAECGLDSGLYGLDGNLPYGYALRRNEGALAFISRLAEWEGARVLAINGKLRGVALDYAQEMEAALRMEITANQEGVTYRRNDNAKYTGLTVLTPWAKATARDSAAKGNNAPTITHLPAMDNAQAGRWARGLLTMHNRMAETLTTETTLNTALATLARVDVRGGTDMDGAWIVDEAEHDLIDARTTATMRRVMDTIR